MRASISIPWSVPTITFNQNNQFAIHYKDSMRARNFLIKGVAPALCTIVLGTYNINNGRLPIRSHFQREPLFNEVRGGINFEHVKQLPLGFYNSNFTAAQIGINQFTLNGLPLPPSQAGFPTLSVSGYLGFGSGTAASNLDYSRTYQTSMTEPWPGVRMVVIPCSSVETFVRLATMQPPITPRTAHSPLPDRRQEMLAPISS